MALQVFQGSASYPSGARPVLTIGNFDGVHRGHQALLRRLLERAQEEGAPSCVYTFEPPPRRVLQPDRCPPRILTLAEKLHALEARGVEQVVVEAFDPAFSRHPASWFAAEILGQRLRPRRMVVGYDFRFGRGREGDAALLASIYPDLPLEAMEPTQVGGGIVSSSRIREAVAEGRMQEASQLLGRPFELAGVVHHGDGRGRTIGFPTANLRIEAELLPAKGVYAVRARRHEGPPLPGVANLGTRPTFDKQGLSFEVHLLDWSGDLYGQKLYIQLVQHLRPERRFDGVDALVAQIRADADQAREVLAP